jgi:hypothetical protein
MAPDPTPAAAANARSETVLRRLLGGMSIFTLLMTVPQVLTIWVGQQAAGVSGVVVERLSSVRAALVLVRNPEA